MQSARNTKSMCVSRVTGYLNVVERFNNAKQSEVQDRVPHGVDYTHTVSGLLDD